MHASLLRRAALYAVLALLVALPATAQQRFDYDEVTERTFKVSPRGTLYLDADLGSVTVRGTRANTISVRVVEGVNRVDRDEAEALFARYDVRFREVRDGLEIRGDYDGPGRMRRNALRVHYEITVPSSYAVELKTAGGSMQVATIEGDARLKTSGGSLTLKDVGGKVDARTSGGSITSDRTGSDTRLHTSGGSITVRDAGGAVDVHTSGGSIRVDGARGEVAAHTSGGSIRLLDVAGAVDAHTSGGSITAEVTRQPQRPMKLETSGGSVTLHLPANVEADIDARASGGRVRFDLPVTVQGDVQRTRLRGTLNGGGPLLTLRSSGGGINLRRQ